MNPGNTFRPFEYIVLLLTVVNAALVATVAGGPQFGVQLSPVFLLVSFVFSTVVPIITNRLDSVGTPQGASYVQAVDHEGKPLDISKLPSTVEQG